MSQCPHCESCPMYPLFQLQVVLEFWMNKYCRADYTKCERYQRSEAGDTIAATLLPNGEDLRRYAKPPAKTGSLDR